MKKILLLGNGGHAKSCIDLIENSGNYKIVGIISKNKKDIGKKLLGYKVIGSDKDLINLVKNIKNIMIGIGFIKETKKKEFIYNYLKKIGYRIPKIISSKSYISKHAIIEDGVNVFHDCFVGPNSKIKEGSLVNNKTLIEHDVTIEKFCHISTSCVINGNSEIGMRSFIGSGSVLINNCKIKKNSFIKMGSLIKK